MPRAMSPAVGARDASTLRWPLVLWSGQLVVSVPLVLFGVARVMGGGELGTLLLPVWIGAICWTTLVAAALAARGGRRWIRDNRLQLALATVTTTLTLVVGAEAAVRVLAQPDEDGNIFVRGHHLRPHHLPVRRVEAAARAYFASDRTFMVADPLLGWAPRPGIQTDDYTYNVEGIRVVTRETTYGEIAPPGVWRVALFGDSYTNGAEVKDDETWGVKAEAELQRRDVPVQVLNFGVNGYGMDQAFLRWRYTGRTFHPDVVVFGLQLENAKRNVNLIRPIYLRQTEQLPFAKPRFVIEEGELRLVNSPVLPPERIADTLRDMNAWPLARYEGHYNPDDYVPQPWHRSRAVSLATGILSDTTSPDANDDITSPDERALAIRILQSFKAEAEAAGARFLVYYMPKRHELRRLQTAGSLPDATFVDELQTHFDLLSAADPLLEEAGRTSLAALYARGGHYSAAGNHVVARVLAERLSAMAAQRTPSGRTPTE